MLTLIGTRTLVHVHVCVRVRMRVLVVYVLRVVAGRQVAGGHNNTASGLYSLALGGHNNTAGGMEAIALGTNTLASHNNSFVFGSLLNSTCRSLGEYSAHFCVDELFVNEFGVTTAVRHLQGNLTQAVSDLIANDDTINATVAQNKK